MSRSHQCCAVHLLSSASKYLLSAFVGSTSNLENFQLVLHVTFFVWCLVRLEDACVAMDEWVQNPKPHTAALDDILPCGDNAAAQEAALRTKDATFQLVTLCLFQVW